MKKSFKLLHVRCGGCANNIKLTLKDEFGEIDVDIYIPYYSRLALPVEEISKQTKNIIWDATRLRSKGGVYEMR